MEVGLIGSCTNSSYQDMSRAASVARQAAAKGLTVNAEFIVNPGSEQVRYTAERDGIISDFKSIGGVIMTNACGPCIGQWRRHTENPERKNSILTSFNRNFAKRADGNPNTHAFIASPEIVTALTIAGDLCFNPLTDTLKDKNGKEVEGSDYYVSGIGGLKEKQHGPMSGWMYSVNGVAPNMAAIKYNLKDGDKVVWYYVNYE